MAANGKQRKVFLMPYLTTTLIFVVTVSIPALLLFHFTPSTPSCNSSSSTIRKGSWSGDLREAEFAWNTLSLDHSSHPENLKIAVFSRKWPLGPSPGGMERHAQTLHAALARRGHRIHVYTTGRGQGAEAMLNSNGAPRLHFVDTSSPGIWNYHEAWSQFEQESRRERFDVVHSESVSLPHHLARSLTNLVVTWHGIALEALQSRIYQDLIRKPNEPMSPSLNDSSNVIFTRLLDEIRFFHNYAHHVAISDSSGEMLRDVYQIPDARVHVILNGVEELAFSPDEKLGRQFREQNGVPRNATAVIGVSGRLVKDKGHPLLHEAFSKIKSEFPGIYLIVAGTGPWEQRYRELGSQVVVLGALPPARLKAFYNSLDIFVNPTLRPQGLDLTLMEAMMCGKPILATRFPSIKGSIVVDPEFGNLFAPNAGSLLVALRTMAREGLQELAKRGTACRNYASSMFSATTMTLAYEKLFMCIKHEENCMYSAP